MNSLYIVPAVAKRANCSVAFHRRCGDIVLVFGLFFHLLHLSGGGTQC